jgi:cytochrome c peroxidase
LAALGASAGYYYNSTQSFKTKSLSTPASSTTEKKKDIDYQRVYNDIAEMLDEDSE